jgi:hypothetical protein
LVMREKRKHCREDKKGKEDERKQRCETEKPAEC